MNYCKVAVATPLFTLLTYTAPQPIALGSRVAVPLRGKTVVGIVWENSDSADTDAALLPVNHIFDDGYTLPEHWRQLIAFTARYYHYPIGQTAFTALPAALRRPKACPLPAVARHVQATEAAFAATAPKHKRQAQLWQAMLAGYLKTDQARTIHPQASKLLEQWQIAGYCILHTPMIPQPDTQAIYQPNAEQTAVIDAVRLAQGFTPFLLYGITGSGKTETYFEMAAETLRRGCQVLFLLPEINLTPQFLVRLQQRFADIPSVVLTSRNSEGERTQGYLKALSGQARLIVGTRLAIFTPLPELGLIVVDEEHDPSYKQDNELRYHARDLAVWRAQQANCPVVLGSATPSLESWHKVHEGHYTLLRLTQRAREQARLPQIHLLDVRRRKLHNGLCDTAIELLKDNLNQGGISMVYLNRRGFAPALFCDNCGHAFGCPHCSAKMVLHQSTRRLHCHHCNYRCAIAQRCPSCGNRDLAALGFGTQRIEETLHHLLPQAHIVRVDRDSVSRKHDWENVSTAIKASQIDILIGTQMLAKGHDFARLNLVIVVDADGSLYSADFRAGERLFAELMQVSGRAGRGETAGQVWIQTRLPEHPVYQMLLRQDHAAFAVQQLAERRANGFAPFTYTAAIRADAPQRETAGALLQQIAGQVAEYGLPEAQEVAVWGPVPMLLAKLAGRERMQVFLESTNRQALHRVVSHWQQALNTGRLPPHTRWSVDVDPQEV